jgi:hypothetical protein
MVRLNKEIRLNGCQNINLKFGTVNKNNPQVIYVSGKMWIQPTYEGNFGEAIDYVRSNFKKRLSKILKNNINFDSKHILDFDVSVDNMISNKKKFCSVIFFIRQKPENMLNLKAIKSVVSSDFNYLFNELENDLIENEFIVTKTKKT